MKILIVSDSHGMKGRLQAIVKHVRADHILHCGDFCTELMELPKGPLTYVQGNCDFVEAPLESLYDVEGWRFFLTHGHRHQVKSSLLPIRYRAEEKGARVACFGHSHVPVCEEDGSVILINPGSISSPRGGFPYPSYVVATLTTEQINIQYYRVDGQPILQLGGSFTR